MRLKVNDINKRASVFIFTLVLFLCTYFTRVEFLENFKLDLNPTLVPPSDLQYFSFGNRELVADLLWIRYLQNIDPCESNCELGWGYKMLDAVTNLSPKFKVAYRSGGDALSVIFHDKEGARRIFERGIKYYPNYTPLLQSYAYHSMFELNHPKIAADLLRRAVQNGAPTWMLSLASRLYEKSGQKELAQAVLKDFIERFPQDAIKRQATERLKQIENEIDSNTSSGNATKK